MQGVEAGLLSRLLDYIYQRQMEVEQDDLKNFLTLAEELQVQGLAETPMEYLQGLPDTEEFSKTDKGRDIIN